MGKQLLLFDEESEQVQVMSLSEFTRLIKEVYAKFYYILEYLEKRNYSIFKPIVVDIPEYLRISTLELVGNFLTSDCKQGNTYNIYINKVHFIIRVV